MESVYTGMEVVDKLEEKIPNLSDEKFKEFMDMTELIELTEQEAEYVRIENSPVYLLETGKGTDIAHLRLALIYLEWWGDWDIVYEIGVDSRNGKERLALVMVDEDESAIYSPAFGDKFRFPGEKHEQKTQQKSSDSDTDKSINELIEEIKLDSELLEF